MSIVSNIIDALDGPTAISDKTGIPVQTVHSWKANGNIPRWRRAGIIDLARRNGKKLPDDALAYLTSDDKAAA